MVNFSSVPSDLFTVHQNLEVKVEPQSVMMSWNTMFGNDMPEVELRQILQCAICCSQDEDHHFCELVNYHKDSIVAIGFRKFSHEIHCDG